MAFIAWEKRSLGPRSRLSLGAGMTPGALWLLVASVALWTGLPAAPPPRRTSGQPPLPPSGAPGEAPQDKIWQEEEARLAGLVAQKSPGPQGKDSGGHGEVGEGSLPPEAAGLSKENPPPERPPATNLEVESSGGPRAVEEPQGASHKDPRAELGGAPASPGGKEKPRSLGRPRLASTPALPNLETWNPVWDPSQGATSAGKTNTSGEPTPGDKPRPPAGKATPTEEPAPASGHTAQDKPKPALAAGHQVGRPSGEDPGAKRGPEAPGRPLAGEEPPSGEKPPSQGGQEKRPSADQPPSSEKPDEGERPGAEKKEAEPEKETGEEEEEEGLFDDDDEGGEKGQENKGAPPEGNQNGDDAFDKELDYGLDQAPWDADSYHDAWSDEGAEGAELGLMGEMAALPQAGDADSGGKPTFDAWGDLVGGWRP